MKDKIREEQVLHRFKRFYVTVDDVKTLIYLSVIIMLIIFPSSGVVWTVVQVSGFFVMIIMPLFMTTYDKFWITFLIGVIVVKFSEYVYVTDSLINIRIGLVIWITFFALFIAYIVMVISDLYRTSAPELKKLSIINNFNRFVFKIRFLYISLAIFLLVLVLLLSFGNIYSGINEIRGTSAFNCVNDRFDGLYLSFTTFFTIGYGDILPVHREAMAFTMAQMSISFIISVLIVPLLIVMMLNLLKSNRKLYSRTKSVNPKRRITKHCQHSNRQPSRRCINRSQTHRYKQRL